MRPLALNGKFFGGGRTGVRRVAEELVRALDGALAEAGREATIIHPRGVDEPPPLRWIRRRAVGRARRQIWEQAELPRHLGGAVLVNLCNLGPLAVRDAVTMIHDAQVFDTPESYAPAFRAYYRALLPRIGRRHRRILTVSEHSRAALIRHGIASGDAIRVVPNGVDHVFRIGAETGAARACGLAPGGYVLALASAQRHKNAAFLAEAFRAPALAKIKLAFFGETPLSAFAPDPPGNVTHLGRVGDARLFGLMAEALAFAAPSTTEGFGLPPLEAMAAGAPVVAAPCGAMPEVLGEAALYAPPDDPRAWTEVIAALHAAPSLRAERTVRGRRRAAGFRWATSARRLLDVVAEIDAEDAAEGRRWAA